MTWLDEPELDPTPEQLVAAGQTALTYASPLVRAVMLAQKNLVAEIETDSEDAAMAEVELEDQREALEMIIRSLLGRSVEDPAPLSEDDWHRGISWLMGQTGNDF